MTCYIIYNNFFFQAEDGIRDYKVTGVQTCALPIWARSCRCRSPQSLRFRAARRRCRPRRTPRSPPRQARSEERRVGKETRTTEQQEGKKENLQEKTLTEGTGKDRSKNKAKRISKTE